MDIRLPEESVSRTIENKERELFIELLTDIDKLGTYETMGSDLILEMAGKKKLKVSPYSIHTWLMTLFWL